MKVIGVCGFARVGKDTFCAIARNILKNNGITAKQYSFAEALKRDVEPFLRNFCGCDVWTNDSEIKADIRDFLVWYGTTWWRKRDPKRWIRCVDNQIRLDGNDIDIAIISDVRYPNEADWIRSWQGYLVHISAYKLKDKIIFPPVSDDDGSEGIVEDIITEKMFFDAPNEQERINDPIIKDQSDYELEWEAKGLNPQDAIGNAELRVAVLKALNSCSFFNESLHL